MKEADRAEPSGGRELSLRDPRLDSNHFAQWRRDICARRGHHWFAHGTFEPSIQTYVARCFICDYVQAIQRNVSTATSPSE